MEKKINSKSDFSQGKMSKNILRLSIPMMVAELVNVFYNLVDRMYIGHIDNVGTVALTGVGICLPLITAISGFGNLFATGGAPLSAIARGKKNNEEAETIQNTSFTMLLIVGAALTAVLFLIEKPVLQWMGADKETLPVALGYFNIYLIGTLFTMITMGMNPFINSQGFSEIGMCTVLIGAVLNLILDPIFIFALDFGVQGAAIATVLSQFVSALWVILFLQGKKAVIRLSRLTVDLEKAKQILSLGISGFSFKVTTAVAQAVTNATLKVFGGPLSTLYIASMSIINSLREVMNQPIFSISHGSQPILGFNYGAGKYDRVRDGIRFVTFSTVSYNFLMWVALQFITRPIILIFTKDSALIEQAIHCVRLYFGAYVMMAFMQTGQSTFVGLNKPKYAVFFSFFRKVILIIPLTIILPRIGMGPDGVFWAELISEVIGAGSCYITMMIVVRKELKIKRELAMERKNV